MSRIKIHEESYSKDTSDEWKDNTYSTVFYFNEKTKVLTSEMTKTFHDYRNNITSADPPVIEVVEVSAAPKIVRKKLQKLGYVD